MRIASLNKIVLCLIILTVSCKTSSSIKPEDAYKLIPAQIEQFHSLYNEKKHVEIVDTFYFSFFIKAAGRDSLIEKLEFYFDKSGRIINSELLPEYKIAINHIDGSKEITVSTKVQFERMKGYEIFVFKVTDEVKLLLHQIHDENDKDLLITQK